MKTPLPPFPRVQLSAEDEMELRAYADTVVQDTIAQYHEHRFIDKEIVRMDLWKKVKTQDNIHLYRERSNSNTIRDSRNNSSNTYSHTSTRTNSSHSDSSDNIGGRMSEWENAISDDDDTVLNMMAVGTLNGKLEDAMLGLHTPTPELMKLKSSYVNDGYIDWAVLATLIRPSEQDPFREMSIKWVLKSHPKPVSVLMRRRDLVYMETTGITTTKNGERIGFHLKHSIQLSAIGELTKYKIVRSKFSFSYLYRQRAPGVVDLYLRGYVSAGGAAPTAFVTATVAAVALSVRNNIDCGHIYKLEWLLKTTKATNRNVTSNAMTATTCSVCHASVGTGLSRGQISEKICSICDRRLCSRCRISKKLFYLDPLEQSPQSTKMVFCSPCIDRAHNHVDASGVAWHHVASGSRHLGPVDGLVR